MPRRSELNRVALEEGETHALNPGSDLDGALNRPRGYVYYQDVRSLYELAALHAVALVEAHAFGWQQANGPSGDPRLSPGQRRELRTAPMTRRQRP